MVSVPSAVGDLLPLLLPIRVSALVFKHTLWERPVVLQERRGETEDPVPLPLVVGVFRLVLSAAPFHCHRLPGWTKKAPPEYKRGAENAISSKF